MDRNIALQISDILSDNVARTPLYGANSLMYFPSQDVAAKTGTTNDRRDAWIVGYTPNLVVGAWAGNNDNRSMNEISGLIITPMWRAFMDVALQQRDVESFAQATRNTPSKPILNGIWFDPGSVVIENNEDEESGELDVSLSTSISGAHSILHYVDKDNPTGPYPSRPGNDSQYALWEYPISLWKGSLMGGLNNEPEEDVVEEDSSDD